MSAHLWDYITDRTSRNAITRRKYGEGGGDCAPFINEARSEGASGIRLPAGGSPLRSSVILENFEIAGEHGNSGALHPYATHGASIEIWDQDVDPIKLGENWGLDRLTFFWPTQMPKEGTPDVYRPLLTPISTETNVTGGHMDRCAVINAYILAELGGNETYAKSGQNAFTNSRLCALKDLFALNHMPDWLNFTGSQLGWDLFGDPMMGYADAPFNAGWRDWVTANSVGFRIKGDGSKSVDGPVLSPLVAYGLKSLILVEAGGTLANLTALGVMADGCQQVLRVEPGGGIVQSVITLGGGAYQHRKHYENDACAPVIDVDDPSACVGLKVRGHVPETKGQLVRIRGENVTSYDIQLGTDGFARTTTPGAYWAAEADCPNARAQTLHITAAADEAVTGDVTRHGVKIACGAVSDVKVQAHSLQTPYEIAATTGCHVVEAITSNTGGARSLVMANPAVVAWSGKMDKPPQTQASASSATPVVLAGSNVATTVLGPIALEAGPWKITAAAEISTQPSPATVPSLGYAMISISSAADTLSSYTQRIDKRAGFNSALAWADGLTLRAGPAPMVLTEAANVYVVVQAGYSGADAPRAKAALYAERVRD